MSKLQLLAIGEAMAELRGGKPADKSETNKTGLSVGFAGDTYNTAVYCKRALADTDTAGVGFFTRVGKDLLSNEFVALAKLEGLDPTYIARDQERLIGIYSVSTDATGERSFSYWRESSAARQLFSHDESLQHLPPARIYYLSGITLAIISPTARRKLMDHLAKLSQSGEALVAFDSNYRPKLWESATVARQTMGEMWEIADIALPSIDDEMDLFGETSEDAVAARFAQRSWHACAIKRGVRGPISPTLTGDQLPEFKPAATVVDTTAAGDSFNGGYLAALLQGQNEAGCLLSGHSAASYVVGHSGAIVPKQ